MSSQSNELSSFLTAGTNCFGQIVPALNTYCQQITTIIQTAWKDRSQDLAGGLGVTSPPSGLKFKLYPQPLEQNYPGEGSWLGLETWFDEPLGAYVDYGLAGDPAGASVSLTFKPYLKRRHARLRRVFQSNELFISDNESAGLSRKLGSPERLHLELNLVMSEVIECWRKAGGAAAVLAE